MQAEVCKYASDPVVVSLMVWLYRRSTLPGTSSLYHQMVPRKSQGLGRPCVGGKRRAAVLYIGSAVSTLSTTLLLSIVLRIRVRPDPRNSLLGSLPTLYCAFFKLSEGFI